jgi:RimJ/RimL family protein N-acetyltransferase
MKSHQGKGIMSQVLSAFFTTHQPALSWIEDTNTASIALFKSLGFTKAKARDDGDRPGHWYLKEKTVPANECITAHASYSW